MNSFEKIFILKFSIFFIVLFIGLLILLIIGYKKKWNAKKSFIIVAIFCTLDVLYLYIFVAPAKSVEEWINNLLLLGLGILSLYGISKIADRRK